MNTNELILAIVTLFFSAVVTPLVILYVNNKTNKKVAVIETKLDENHKQQNGNLTKLLKTTADLATANEKAKQEAIKK